MSINSSKDFEKWPTGCHNLNHLIWWQILSTGGSLLIVDLLISVNIRLFRFVFFLRSAILWQIHSECSTVWCAVFRSLAYPFRIKWNTGNWIRWIPCEFAYQCIIENHWLWSSEKFDKQEIEGVLLENENYQMNFWNSFSCIWRAV